MVHAVTTESTWNHAATPPLSHVVVCWRVFPTFWGHVKLFPPLLLLTPHPHQTIPTIVHLRTCVRTSRVQYNSYTIAVLPSYRLIWKFKLEGTTVWRSLLPSAWNIQKTSGPLALLIPEGGSVETQRTKMSAPNARSRGDHILLPQFFSLTAGWLSPQRKHNTSFLQTGLLHTRVTFNRTQTHTHTDRLSQKS